MTAEQFCLRWNNHQSTLVSVFDGLFESGTLVDCTLAADGQYLKAHKVVLSACSPYLEALLSQHYNQHPIVILKDVKFEELKAMLEYMYRGEVNVTQEQLGRFLKAAETLKIKGLTNNDVGPAAGQITPVVPPTGANTATVPTVAPPSLPIVTSVVTGTNDTREAPVRTRQEIRKSLHPVQLVQPRSPIGNQISLVETLKNAPASLVIDIPPISPVNSTEGSISPTPRKCRKRKQSYNDEFASNVENNRQKLNSDFHGSSISEKSNESVLDVDPLAILETGLVKPEVKIESGDGNGDDGDSEGELTMDEDYDPSSKAGPSNGSSIAADGGAWGAASDDGENAESSKVQHQSVSDQQEHEVEIQSSNSIYSPFHGLSRDHLNNFGIKQEEDNVVKEENTSDSLDTDVSQPGAVEQEKQLPDKEVSFVNLNQVISNDGRTKINGINNGEAELSNNVVHCEIIKVLSNVNSSPGVVNLPGIENQHSKSTSLLPTEKIGGISGIAVDLESSADGSEKNNAVAVDKKEVHSSAEGVHYNFKQRVDTIIYSETRLNNEIMQQRDQSSNVIPQQIDKIGGIVIQQRDKLDNIVSQQRDQRDNVVLQLREKIVLQQRDTRENVLQQRDQTENVLRQQRDNIIVQQRDHRDNIILEQRDQRNNFILLQRDEREQMLISAEINDTTKQITKSVFENADFVNSSNVGNSINIGTNPVVTSSVDKNISPSYILPSSPYQDTESNICNSLTENLPVGVNESSNYTNTANDLRNYKNNKTTYAVALPQYLPPEQSKFDRKKYIKQTMPVIMDDGSIQMKTVVLNIS